MNIISGRLCVDLPIIRKAGLPASLEEVAGEASLEGNLSAIIEAPLQPRSIWSQKL